MSRIPKKGRAFVAYKKVRFMTREGGIGDAELKSVGPRPDPRDRVFVPGPGKVFVFGSNLGGIHGAGAAAKAFEEYGAEWGVGEGHMGDPAAGPSCYAIPTKDERIMTLELGWIAEAIAAFLGYAKNNPELEFFVTRIGCGLAGYTDQQVAPLFKGAPANCVMPVGWPEGPFEVIQ